MSPWLRRDLARTIKAHAEALDATPMDRLAAAVLLLAVEVHELSRGSGEETK